MSKHLDSCRVTGMLRRVTWGANREIEVPVAGLHKASTGLSSNSKQPNRLGNLNAPPHVTTRSKLPVSALLNSALLKQ
jgi:hypothetical protein